MDCLYAKCEYYKRPFSLILLHSPFLAGIPCVTDCVIAELEKLGQRYRLALRCVTVCAPFLPTILILLLVWLVTPALSAFLVHTLVPMLTIVSYNE